MSLWCNSCNSHGSAQCAARHHLPEDLQRSPCNRRFRSTKGASKARRDQINHEIRNMRDLLPINQEDKERLSYLHSMAAICSYIRKSVLFQGISAAERSHSPLSYETFLQALHGFILVTTTQGKLVYVSENVHEYLGISMVDVLQGDTVFDMVEQCDVDIVKANLDMEKDKSSERSFVCCMQTSKAFKLLRGSCCSVMVRGSFQRLHQLHPSFAESSPVTEGVFVSLCTPTVDRVPLPDAHLCLSFTSTHGLDMSFTWLSDSVVYLLGYEAKDVIGRSWYSLVHPEDLMLSAESHRKLIQADGGLHIEMVLRFQSTDLSWTWIYIRASKDSECQSISCTNFIISDTEAKFLREKLSAAAFRPSSVPFSCEASHSQTHSAKCFKKQRLCDGQSEKLGVSGRTKLERDTCHVEWSSSRGDSSPVSPGDVPSFFTPPYSPASSSSPFQPEELDHDLLIDVHENTDLLLSSPESSPSYYSYPEAGFTCHLSPSNSLHSPAEQTYDRGAFAEVSSHTLLSTSSLSYDFQPCTANARLVPDCLSVYDMCESPVDCALHPDDLGLLEQPQESGFAELHHVPQHAGILTPNSSPASTESTQYNEREQAEISILAQQISSLASSFDMNYYQNQYVDQPGPSYTSLSAHSWPNGPPASLVKSPKHELLLDCMFDCILKDLEGPVKDSSSPISPGVIPQRYQQGSVGSDESSGMQSGHHNQNRGLHQLNEYRPNVFLQDGLAEENLY